MKIMRYRQRIVGDFTPDPEMGPWCRYKDVEPLLERIKELEQQLEDKEKSQNENPVLK